MLQVNLRLESSTAKEMSFEWKSEVIFGVKLLTAHKLSQAGILENISMIVNEYKEARGLIPIKIVIHGAPSSGKTTFAKQIASHYKIHYVEIEQVMAQVIHRMVIRYFKEAFLIVPQEKSFAKLENPEMADETSEVDDLDANREIIDEIIEYSKANNGKYPNEYIIKFLREKMFSMPCKNQGYILDGFPTTVDEAIQLFKGVFEI
jgi:adenylate kinase